MAAGRLPAEPSCVDANRREGSGKETGEERDAAPASLERSSSLSLASVSLASVSLASVSLASALAEELLCCV